MRFAIALACATLGDTAVAQDTPPESAGPRGTSGEVRDDTVGRATLLTVSADVAPTVRIAAMHPTLPSGSFVEVTALDTGRTIAAMVVGPYRGRGIVGLSPDAAQALGIAEGATVRVRSVTPSPQDQAALRRGEAAGTRLDAPPALLTALRRKLSTGMPAPGARPERTGRPQPAARPAAVAPPVVRPTVVRGGYGVQVAALSSSERAAALARMLGGRVVSSGRLYRVQLGPYADTASAARARDAVVRQGYRDARIFHTE